MTRAVSFGGHDFPLVAEPPMIGDMVLAPGAGLRALYVAPSLERWPTASASDFVAEVRRIGNATDFLVCSADQMRIAEDWAGRAGWTAVRFDSALAARLGLWMAKLSLPARALLIVDATSRLRYCQIAVRLEDDVAFDEAHSALKTVVG